MRNPKFKEIRPNYRRNVLEITLKLSVRVIADALNTSPSQVMRLLQENKGSKQFIHFIQLADLAGYQIKFSLRKKKAA